uniref:Integrase core domain containing protein n=1 Tax=Solanum tuberosum TaxID=4113 RepID=M1DRZ1_SOLTU
MRISTDGVKSEYPDIWDIIKFHRFERFTRLDPQCPNLERTDVQVTPISSNDIQKIKVDYLRDDVARRKTPPLDTTLVVDPTTLKINVAHPAPSVEPSGTIPPSVIPSTSSALTSSSTPTPRSWPPLTKALIYHMGNLARSTDTRVSRLERELPKNIERAVEVAMCPVRADIMLHRTTLASADVDQLRSTNISILWGEVRLTEMPEVVPPYEMRVDGPDGVTEQPTNVDDKVGDDDDDKEKDEDEFL